MQTQALLDGSDAEAEASSSSSETERRQRTRSERVHAHTHWQRVCVLACSALLVGAGLVLAIAGGIILGAAEHERLHGWRDATCRVHRQYNFTDPTCVFFSVTFPGRRAEPSHVCAVPANVAARAAIRDGPACGSPDTLRPWFALGNGSSTDCLVPASVSAVAAEQCVAVATTTGTGAAAWRAYNDRLVYLVETPSQGPAVLAAATLVQRNVGTGLVVAGCVLVMLAYIGTFHNACASWPGQYRGLRVARRHREYAERKQY